jgi:hypothetical protein
MLAQPDYFVDISKHKCLPFPLSVHGSNTVQFGDQRHPILSGYLAPTEVRCAFLKSTFFRCCGVFMAQ